MKKKKRGVGLNVPAGAGEAAGIVERRTAPPARARLEPAREEGLAEVGGLLEERVREVGQRYLLPRLDSAARHETLPPAMLHAPGAA